MFALGVQAAQLFCLLQDTATSQVDSALRSVASGLKTELCSRRGRDVDVTVQFSLRASTANSRIQNSPADEQEAHGIVPC